MGERETAWKQTAGRRTMPEATRAFKDGKMVVTMPSGRTREVSQERLQGRIDNMAQREQAIAERRTTAQGWLDQAKASE